MEALNPAEKIRKPEDVMMDFLRGVCDFYQSNVNDAYFAYNKGVANFLNDETSGTTLISSEHLAEVLKNDLETATGVFLEKLADFKAFLESKDVDPIFVNIQKEIVSKIENLEGLLGADSKEDTSVQLRKKLMAVKLLVEIIYSIQALVNTVDTSDSTAAAASEFETLKGGLDIVYGSGVDDDAFEFFETKKRLSRNEAGGRPEYDFLDGFPAVEGGTSTFSDSELLQEKSGPFRERVQTIISSLSQLVESGAEDSFVDRVLLEKAKKLQSLLENADVSNYEHDALARLHIEYLLFQEAIESLEAISVGVTSAQVEKKKAA
jgi:hypothetical protein